MNAAKDEVSQPQLAATVSERRYQLSCGIMLGLGLALIIAGSLGWLFASHTYTALDHYFSYGRLSEDFYLFDDLTTGIATFLSLILLGTAAILFGTIVIKKRAARELLSPKNPHASLGGALIGVGFAFAFASTRTLFLYVLATYYFEFSPPPFELFAIPFIIGAFIFALGILTLKRK